MKEKESPKNGSLSLKIKPEKTANSAARDAHGKQRTNTLYQFASFSSRLSSNSGKDHLYR